MSNRCVNKVILIGYLGQDPEVRYMSNGNVVTTINLATSDNWKDKETGELKSKTNWHRVVFFGKIAEISSEYLKKGYHIYIEGQLKNRKWKDQDGNEKYIVEIIVSINGVMKILNSKFNTTSWDENEKNIKNELKKTNKEDDDEIDFDNIKDNDFNEEDIPF